MTNKTALRHLKAVLKRSEQEDFTTNSEDNALRHAIDVLHEPFSDSELATILAALRLYQETESTLLPRRAMPHFYDAPPLSNEDIDDLCERINCGE